MTAPSVVSSVIGSTYAGGLSGNPHTIPYPTGSGGLIVAFVGYGEVVGQGIASFSGFTQLGTRGQMGVVDGWAEIWYREADGSEGTNFTVVTNVNSRMTYNVYRISGYGDVPVQAGWIGNGGSGFTSQDSPALTSGFGVVDTLWIAVHAASSATGTITGYPSGYTGQYYTDGVYGPIIATARKAATAASEDPGSFTTSINSWQTANTVAIKGLATPEAEFSWDETGVRTLQFTDESTNVPTSWAWTFGDSGTSTAQNPSHVYAAAGSYTVSLTVTNSVGSDSVSHVIEVIDAPPYEPPSPGLAILEIYVNDPSGPKWDEAEWDGASWGSAGWVDVTPQGVSCRIQWGSTRPELGILAQPEAMNAYITFYDPNRILDPANEDGPYWSDLKPGLPWRIRHRGVVVKTGQADVIGHSFRDDSSLIRGSDCISLMARTDVPEDASLGDSLGERAQDAIAAAGLSVQVYTGGLLQGGGLIGPELGAKMDGVRSVWAHILDAAQSVMYTPYVTNDNRIAFKPYANPHQRGRVLASPNLIDLNDIVDTAGLISEVHVQQTPGDGGLLIERAITPPPWFGRRIFERTEETPDADDWADAVLADRSLNTLRWVPGEVYPITADDVDYFATLLPVELVGLQVDETSPTVDVSAVILGGTITVVGRQNDSASWRFQYECASSSLTTGLAPLYADGGTPADYLTSESGSEYLYPD